MKDKVCIITGATSGIGKAIALELAKLDARAILVGKDIEKGKDILNEIYSESSNKEIRFMRCDLSSITSINSFVEEFKSKYVTLHCLINCGGLYRTKRYETPEEFELTFMVNYLSRFLLTNQLIELMLKSTPARIINVCGEYHRKGKINFNDLQSKNGYNAFRANAQVQLANILFTHESARRLEYSGVTVNCYHPGAIKTGIATSDPDLPFIKKLLYNFSSMSFKSPEKGAETGVYLATDKNLNNITGQYFINKTITKSSSDSYDIGLSYRLWDMSEKLLNLTWNIPKFERPS